jgi:hypothetical protein
MNRIIKSTMLVLVAIMAFGAMSTASAWAVEESTPAFLPATGKTFPVKFGGEGLGNAELNTSNILNKVVCTSTLILGEILPRPTTTSSMLGDVHFLFHKCTAFGVPCNSPSQPSGLIETKLFLFHIGRLLTLPNGKKDVLIVILIPNSSKVEFTCGTNKVEVEGNLVGLIPETGAGGGSQYNQQLKELLIEFTQESGGKQSLTTFENTLPIETITGLHLIAHVNGVEEEGSEVAKGDTKLEGTETAELRVP